ncbi:hypothetical protein [Cnuella takakiae]|uniref:hypothetical protein n=1 Tax=Cnuella takakiae TaxID=1302690 RepID=UPI000979E1F2|nr:hypothetical protein [Cnuella takakiae]OLY93683.1 hypothetical protein BUE76_18705 [Cnuella takakiae]
MHRQQEITADEMMLPQTFQYLYTGCPSLPTETKFASTERVVGDPASAGTSFQQVPAGFYERHDPVFEGIVGE